MHRRFSITIIKKINAPRPYAFDWLTDFSEDDHLITGSTVQKKSIEKVGDKVTYIAKQEKNGIIVRRNCIVTLIPPDKWKVAATGEEKDIRGEYHLSPDGDDGTVFEMTLDMNYKVGPVPTKDGVEKENNEVWDKYVEALVDDYIHERPAR